MDRTCNSFVKVRAIRSNTKDRERRISEADLYLHSVVLLDKQKLKDKVAPRTSTEPLPYTSMSLITILREHEAVKSYLLGVDWWPYMRASIGTGLRWHITTDAIRWAVMDGGFID